MKRSKVFLAITTCLLTIAGISAAKKFGPPIPRLYCTIGNASGKYCALAGSFTAISNPNGAFAALVPYTSGTISHTVLAGPLYTSGVVGAKCGASNCIHQLKYTLNN